MRPDEMIRRALDGELGERARPQFEALLAEDPEFKARYESQLSLKGELSRMPRVRGSEVLPDRVMKEVLAQRTALASLHSNKSSWGLRFVWAAAAAFACAVAGFAGYQLGLERGQVASAVPEIRVASQTLRRPSPRVCREAFQVRFVLRAPGAKTVAVAGDFNGWSKDSHRMRDPEGDGVWTLTVTLRPGVYQYNLLVDGTRWVKDPAADAFRPDGFGGVNSVLRL